MSTNLPKKALIAITSHSAKFYPDGGINGAFYTEILHPYLALTSAGFTVDLASETGTHTIDPYSLTSQFISGDDVAIVGDGEHPINKLLNGGVKKASSLIADDYGMFFASAGFASVYDYPTASVLQSVASDIWARGGVVAAVCHGGAIFPGVKDGKTGKSIVDGLELTGFSTEADKLAGVLDKIHDDGVLTTEESAVKAGGRYVAPPAPFDDFSVTSGRLVTGANPFSARSAAAAAIVAFEAL
ncbi:molecular chaperone Hsp31 [Rhizobium sp. SG570]|uniref:molecular chaperone Hsp31 n=1 Tax=Rhizobium sp. SG570 TaxID=2587113 RepID=UPI001448788B|nr:molecular chaperone Hsp31 [Rhizobium sp. SG570]NKJ38475.1 putative intracellular protease/amidase [Rhizobium sp. SG570]